MSHGLDQATLEPHLTDVFRSGYRYPNPFFDLGMQYTPRTVKELFQWCTYFYYSNPLVGSAITKISRYPITNMIVEDSDSNVREKWSSYFNDHLKIKDRMMEVNLDLNCYGNAFVTPHLPFTRFLVCKQGHRTNIRDVQWKWSDYKFHYTCPICKQGAVGNPEDPETIKDVPYRSIEDVRIIRWNPENIIIRYNEATARTVYYYQLSPTLKHQITTGEQDVLEDIPLLFIQAQKHSRVIKLSNKNIFHLKRPTLAEKDMGWGKPLIYHVMKDLYYMATLRKAQEAIANEHIVPFDFLFPQPNAQMDPFVHSDLGNWRMRVEEMIKKHRWDPNYKAVLPVPIGFGRLGGDGKALMITPELNQLTQTVVGGMGIPQEFIFGGLSWTGSSITLRSLENDFLHNQTQLLELTNWLMKKLSVFLKVVAPKKVRFLDFKMADDIQRIQQFIGLNAQRKISNETLLTELGLDYEKETKRIISETTVDNKIQEIMSRAQAKISGEAQLISFNFQQKINDLQGGVPDLMASEQSQLAPVEEAQMQPGHQDQTGNDMPQAAPTTEDGQTTGLDVHKLVKTWASKLMKLDPTERSRMIMQIKQQSPSFGVEIEKALAVATSTQNATGGGASASQANPNSTEVNMTKLPEKGAPMRAGSF